MRNLLPSKREHVLPSLFDSEFGNDLFDRFFKESHYPKVDIKEVNNGYELKMDVPGFSKEDIKVEYRDGYIDLQGSREESKETKEDDGYYIRKERSYGSFRRSFYVGDIDESKIHGSFKDGMLQLQIPKANEDENKNRKQIQLD
ncbi:Hsp20/alpha crystallin family protein [Planococcus sp. SSTMD024]|uniref:Hsp20/alpha crystallin family protein n=1 Tax=Planococcus sp. SSTMD024 TaxID=3242163 RepID=UPI00351EBD15